MGRVAVRRCDVRMRRILVGGEGGDGVERDCEGIEE